MNDIGEGTIRRIDWQELIPAVLLLRIFNTALSLRVMFFAFIGFVLSLILLANFSVGSPLMPDMAPVPGIYNDLTTLLPPFSQLLQKSVLVPPRFFYGSGHETFTGNPQSLIVFFGGIIAWLFFGGLICRTVAVRFTANEGESLPMMCSFLWKRGWGFVTSLLIPAVGILCCLLPVKLAIWLIQVSELYAAGLNIAEWVLFPFILLFAFFAAVLAAGLVLGFPLLFSAVAVEGADGFDAVSRMYSYFYQRPLHYTVYWFYAAVLGIAGFITVRFFVFLTLQFICLCFHGDIPAASSPMMFCIMLCSLLPPVYSFAWFWTSSVAIYLLLRRSVDATPFNEVYRLEQPKQIVLPNLE